MKAKISTKVVQALKPSEKAFEVVDTQLKGFLLRVQPTGRMTFYFTYRIPAGNRKRIKIGTLGPELTIQQARDTAIKYAGEVIEGLDIQNRKQTVRQKAIEAKEKTLSRFMNNHYKPWALVNLKTGRENISRVNYSFTDILQTPLENITVAYVEKWCTQKLNSGTKASTVNRCVQSLRAVLTKAVEWDAVSDHPLRKLKPLQMDISPKVRYLSEDEEKRLLQTLTDRDASLKQGRARGNNHRRQRGYELLPEVDQFTYADRITVMVILSLKTGMRRGELFDVEWHSVSFEHKTITATAETTKSKRIRHIPLSPIALKALQQWKEQTVDPTGRVFPSDNGGRLTDVKRSWASLMKDAEIESFRWHDMRHDFASKLVMRGIPLNTVRELCGHSNLNTTLRYAHLAPDHKADAIAVLG